MRRRALFGNRVPAELQYDEKYMTVEALEDGLIVTFDSNVSTSVYYCINNDGNWIEMSGNTSHSTIAVNTGDCISFKGVPNANKVRYYGIGTFSMNKYCNLLGNCMSLLYGDEADTNTEVYAYGFYQLFKNCRYIKHVSENFLPATDIGIYAYDHMFSFCTSLEETPIFYMTNSARSCCMFMFSYCTSLTTAHDIKSSSINDSACRGMFEGCTSLITAPSLPNVISISNEGCYSMFEGCTSLTNPPKMSKVYDVGNLGCAYMFEGCTSLTTTPTFRIDYIGTQSCSYMFSMCSKLKTNKITLNVTTLGEYCYEKMFDNCANLTTAPELPATILVSGCYYEMFNGCTKLNYIKMLATDISATDCLSSWVNDVASTGTFVKNVDATWDVSGESGIPVGWTIETV